MITNEKISNHREQDRINFIEIFDIEELQRLQDLFADTHGVASIITYPDGKPITKPSNFCRLCNDVIRKTEKGMANCIKSDAEIGCYNPKGAIIKKCLSGGLWDAGASINIGNKQIANWLIGQVRNEETDFNSIMQYADEIGANRKIFAEAYKEVPEMSSEKFKKIANLLFAFANELSDKAYKNLLLKKQIKEIEITKQELINAKEKAEINEIETALIVESVAEGIGFVNKDEVFEFVNSASENIFETNKGELVGKSLYDFLDKEESLKLKRQILSRKQGITSTYELKIITDKNNNKYIQVSATPSINNSGEYIGAYGAVRDITNQKLYDKALKVNEEKYRLLAENVTDIIWTMNIRGKYQYISPSVLNMLGYKPEEFINKTFGELLTKESEIIAKNYFIETSELILSGYKPESKNLTLEIFKSDGNPIWTEINITAIFEKNEFKYFLGVTRNINERKKAEENTIKIKKYYQAIIENAPDGVALINDNGTFKYISPSAKKMFGFDINEELNINPNEYTHPDDLEFVITNLTKLINDSSFIPTLQYRFLDKNGNWKWIETTMRNLLSDENIEAIVLNFRDINDRKIIEQELNQAKETYYDIFNSVSEAIYIQDEKGTFIDINEGAEKIYGYSREELIGKNPVDVAAPDFNNLVETQRLSLKVLKTGIPQRFDFWAVKKNGEIFPKEVIVNKGKYFGKEVLIATARDITEQKNAEEKIRNSEEKYRFIAENTSDGIVTFNHLSQITYVSPSYLNQIGYSEEEELSRNKESIYELIHPEDREITYANIFEAINLKKTNLTYSYRVKHKDGHYIWREDNATFKYDENMQYAGANVICRDITKRIQTELITKAQYKIANLLLTSKNLDELLACIQTELKNIINVNNFYVAIYDKKTDLLSAPFVSDIIDKNRKWKAEKSFTGIVIKNNQTLLINTEKEFEDYYHKGEAILLGKQAKTWLGAPLNINNEVIGAIVIQDYEKEYAYTEKEVEILQFISNQISIAIKRKKDEQQIRLLAKSIEQSPVSIVITNNEGIIEYVNSKFSEISNYSSEEIIGKNVNILKSGKQNSDVYKNLWDTISNGNQWFGELHNKKKNGEFYWESVNISPVVDENANITHYVAIKEDITERKNIYEELIHSKKQIEESEQKYKEIFDNTQDNIFIFDVVNNNRLKIIALNRTEENLIGSIELYKNKYIEDCLPEEIYKLVKPNYDRCLNLKQAIDYEENINGQFFYTQLIPLFNNENKIYRLIGISRDITEIKSLTNDLIKQNNQLKIINTELNNAKEMAQESDKLKTAFLHNISHEIRTPFNGILGFLQFVGDDDITQEERREYINIINRSSMRLINTINDIVDISQIQAGQAKLYLSEVNIPKTLAELHEFFFAFAEIKNLDLAIQNTNNLNIIKTDYNKLKAIFSFLIDNAIKFTKTGKVEFGIAQHNQLPDFINVKDKYTYFFVKDTGVGIPKDKQAIIFDKFMQADVSDTRGYEGSGLGLSIAMAYTQILGGDIFLESEVGKGSIFYFSISREPLNIDNKTITLNSNYQNRKKTKLNIIIAEDDENSEIFIRTMIKSISNNLYVARTGRECIELCKNNADTDLILMDIKMPDMNGDEACKEIRKFNNDVIIIAQTAFAFNSDKLNAIQAGCNDFIAKPLNKNNFFSLIYKYFTINNL